MAPIQVVPRLLALCVLFVVRPAGAIGGKGNDGPLARSAETKNWCHCQ